MKNRFLNFLKKYWLCILLSIIMIIGVLLSTRYANLYKTGSDSSMIRFDLRDLYLIYGLPLYSLIYGCLSYIKTKKIWIPQLILCFVSFLYWFQFDITTLAWAGTYIWTVYPVAFSIFGASITAFIYYLIIQIKERCH